jgi:y4mF family transcriptional regulator
MRLLTAADLGHAVRTLRRAQGITQAQLAMTAGTNRRFIVDLERGKPTSQLGKALEVLAVLGAAAEVAMPGVEPSATPTTVRRQR